MQKTKLSSHYGRLLRDIKTRIHQARHQSLKAVNTALIELYWDVGKMIVERQSMKGWGSGVVERLARDLQQEFPESRGFSTQNLWRMRQFYETYRQKPILSTLLRELPWAHNLLIMNRVKRDAEREFYLRSSIEHRWSFRELERQIRASLFKRTPFKKSPSFLKLGRRKDSALIHFRDEYVFDLLGLKNRHKEKDLRQAILANLKDFFLEFGRYFTFAGEEYRLNVGGDDFFVDLLFYHRLLRCFVAVELKIGKFKPEYTGKMQFYLGALDEKVRTKYENPSVGIILCKSKNEEVVRIATSRAASPIKVATYKTRLVDQKLLKRKLHSLPSPAD